MGFITRLHRQCVVTILEQRTVSKAQKALGVLLDQWVLLGPKDGSNPLRVRLVTYYDKVNEREFQSITNVTKLGAFNIAQAYKQRWQIELLFKGLKCSMITGDTVATIFQEPDPFLVRVETGNVAISTEGPVKDDVEPAPAGKFAHDPTDFDSAAAAVDMPAYHYENVPTSDPRDGEGLLGIAGFVEDVRTGRMLPEAIIQLRGTNVRVRCNERGYFGLRVPKEMVGQYLILDIRVPGSGEMALPLPPKGTPFYAPIKFLPDTHALLEPIATTDLSPFVIGRERQTQPLGGVCVVTCHVPPPTVWQRIVAPIKRGWNNVRH